MLRTNNQIRVTQSLSVTHQKGQFVERQKLVVLRVTQLFHMCVKAFIHNSGRAIICRQVFQGNQQVMERRQTLVQLFHFQVVCYEALGQSTHGSHDPSEVHRGD